MVSRRLVDTRLGQVFKQPVLRALGKAGWEVRRRDFEDPALLLPKRMRRHDIATVLDVGANVGQFATRLRLAGYEGDLLSFEPGPAAFALLRRASAKDERWRCIQVAAGRARSTLTLEVSRNSTSSSLLPISKRHVRAAPASEVVNQVSVPVERIDHVASSYDDLSPPYLLKLDVQGYELAALEGATGLLERTPVVCAELSFVELFEGGAGYIDVLTALGELGYVVVDVQAGFRDPVSGDLLQCDVTLVQGDPGPD